MADILKTFGLIVLGLVGIVLILPLALLGLILLIPVFVLLLFAIAYDSIQARRNG